MTPAKFFTPEMGLRLRSLRCRRGLSLAELARRMGLNYRGAKSSLAKLEKGKIAEPRLSTITYYLRACGALFSEFYDTLTRVESVPIDLTPVLRSGLPTKRQQRIIEQTGKQVQKYHERIAYPLVAAPMKPERQRRAVEGLRQYRMQVNIIDEEVVQLLEKEADRAKAERRPIPVRYYDYFKYKLLARRILSVMRKHGEAGFKHKGAKARSGKSEQLAVNSRSKPRKKSLEQRLEEALRFVSEQALNPEVSELVKQAVIRRYETLRGAASSAHD